MSFPVVRGQRAAWRGLAALCTAAAFLLALALSDAPGWHERIHKTQGAGHECVVTILSAASVALCGAAVIVAEPAPAPEAFAFLATPSTRATAPLDFLLLEHAPPAQA